MKPCGCGCSGLCNCRSQTGSYYLTPTIVEMAVDEAICAALLPKWCEVYRSGIASENYAQLSRAWYSIMEAIDDDPCATTRPRREWRSMFDGYDALKRAVLTRYRQKAKSFGMKP